MDFRPLDPTDATRDLNKVPKKEASERVWSFDARDGWTLIRARRNEKSHP